MTTLSSLLISLTFLNHMENEIVFVEMSEDKCDG